MATPPKRPTKTTAPAKKTSTPPASSSSPTTSTPRPDLVADLREGVIALADRVNSLSTALTTVNEIQRVVMANERKAKENAKKTQQIESDLIPRAEHEKRWKKEQEQLIQTRLSIRRQTYVVGAVFFLLAMTALAIVAVLLVRDIHEKNVIRHNDAVKRCQQGNDFRAQDKELWNEVIGISQKGHTQTPAQIQTTKQFRAFLDKHDAPADCSKAN